MRNGTRKAFTLLELIVAILLMTIVATMLASLINVAFKLRDSAQYAVDMTRDTEIIGDKFVHELANVVQPSQYYLSQDSETGTPQTLGTSSGTTTQPATQPAYSLFGPFNGDSARVTFYTSGATASKHNSNLPYADIKYAEFTVVSSGDDRGLMLVERVNTDLLSDQSQSDPTSELDDFVLATHVKSVRFQYYDGQGTWSDSWDCTDTNLPQPLPYAVKMELYLEGVHNGDPDRVVTRYAALVCSVPTTSPSTDDGTGTDGGIQGQPNQRFGQGF